MDSAALAVMPDLEILEIPGGSADCRLAGQWDVIGPRFITTGPELGLKLKKGTYLLVMNWSFTFDGYVQVVTWVVISEFNY